MPAPPLMLGVWGGRRRTRCSSEQLPPLTLSYQDSKRGADVCLSLPPHCWPPILADPLPLPHKGGQ